MRRIAFVLVVASTAFAAGASAKSVEPPLLGIVGKRVLYQQLTHFDPLTLKPFGHPVPLGGHREGWSFAPNGQTLVLGAGSDASCVDAATSLRLVDVHDMRVLGDVSLGLGGAVQATSWTDGSHVVGAASGGDCITHQPKNEVVFGIDALTRQVQAKTSVHGALVSSAPGPGMLVLLLSPAGRIGPARLAVVDTDGYVRLAALPGVQAGRFTKHDGSYAVSAVEPGLAVDPASRRAFVVSANDRVFEVELDSLHVHVHTLSVRHESKGERGSIRQAVWLGNGTLAVTGINLSVTTGAAGGDQWSQKAIGLRFVDTRSWASRTLDPNAGYARLAGRMLLATGSSYTWVGTNAQTTSIGLVAYSLSGHRRYQLFDGEDVAFAMGAPVGGRVFANVPGPPDTCCVTTVFDLATGRLVAKHPQPVYQLLVGSPSY
jgi:hypothetical protein